MPGNGGCGDPGVESSGNQRTKPWFPFRSSVTARLTWEGWKSSGLAVSCFGFKAVTPRRSARWWLLSRPHRHEGRDDAELAHVLEGVCQNRPHRWPYLTDVLRRIAAITPGDTAALEALLPDRWLAAHPEHRLEQREEESREAQARRRRKRAARRIASAY
jgi:hypothetical protein